MVKEYGMKCISRRLSEARRKETEWPCNIYIQNSQINLPCRSTGELD